MWGKDGNAGQVGARRTGAPLTLSARAAPLPIRRAGCGARARDGRDGKVVVVVHIKGYLARSTFFSTLSFGAVGRHWSFLLTANWH